MELLNLRMRVEALEAKLGMKQAPAQAPATPAADAPAASKKAPVKE